jgi:predicted transcriptional regulator
MTPREYAKKTNIPERTVYSMIKDVDFSDIHLLLIGNNKYIPGLCN